MNGADHRPPALPGLPGVVLPVRVDRRGVTGPTKDEARGSSWVTTSRGLHLPSWVDRSTPEQRIAEAGAILGDGFGGITGWAALRWAGAAWFDGTTSGGRERRDVVLATSIQRRRPQPGVATSEEGLPPSELIMMDGLPVTTPIRSVCFEMRYAASVQVAVTAFDMAAYQDLVSRREIEEYAAALSSWTGIPRCREAIPLTDENAWSPQEVTMRLLWQLGAGRPRPLSNQPLFDRWGNHLGTPDLIDPEAGVIGEYDGALHLEGTQRSRDVERDERYRRHGLEVFVMLTGDSGNPGRAVDRLESAYRRARHEAPSRRSWTLTPPPWWIPTETVDQRRSLSPMDRARLLRLRRRAA